MRVPTLSISNTPLMGIPLIILALARATCCADGPLNLTPKPLANAENVLDVSYQPQRIADAWQDRWLKLNVHWPKGAKDGQRFPCIVFIHGGGYGGGDKDKNFCGKAMQKAVDQGFAVANLNYILGRNLFPQVFYDYRAAIRFLRANAEKFHIDPQRMGTWGFSAGGWLSSSGNFTDAGDTFVFQRSAISADWPADHELRKKYESFLPRLNKDQTIRLAVPMDDPRPAYGDYSARIQAHQGDFNQYEQNITPDAPAILTYIGKGGVNRMRPYAKEAGIDYTELVLSHPKKKWDGARAIHVPPLDLEVPSPDGKDKMALDERVLHWFRQRLIENPVSPVPELRPHIRSFTKKVAVEMVVPQTPGKPVAVHYTTDGTAPTARSPKWDGPLNLSQSTRIKAISVVSGMKPSGVATAMFTKVSADQMPPVISEPAPDRLPGAKVGNPYAVKFAVNGDRKAVYKLIAHYRPENMNKFKGPFSEFSGLQFDASTGVLSGTPTRAFVYTIQLQAAWAAGKPADVRTWVLKVEQ